MVKPCRNGLVRNSAKFGDNRCRKSDSASKTKAVMSKAAIVAQFPKFTAATTADDRWDVKKMFGKAATKLTKSLAKKLEGKCVYMVWQLTAGSDLPEKNDREYWLAMLRITDAYEPHDNCLWADVIESGKKMWTRGVHWIYYDGDNAVTGPDQDPVYVFVLGR